MSGKKKIAKKLIRTKKVNQYIKADSVVRKILQDVRDLESECLSLLKKIDKELL